MHKSQVLIIFLLFEHVGIVFGERVASLLPYSQRQFVQERTLSVHTGGNPAPLPSASWVQSALTPADRLLMSICLNGSSG